MTSKVLLSAADHLTLIAAHHALLRKTLEHASGNPSARQEQRDALRELCIRLRRAGQPPEQLLIAFKSSLEDAANEAKLPYGPERNALLSGVVSIFIEELYGYQRPRSSIAETESLGREF